MTCKLTYHFKGTIVLIWLSNFVDFYILFKYWTFIYREKKDYTYRTMQSFFQV